MSSFRNLPAATLFIACLAACSGRDANDSVVQSGSARIAERKSDGFTITLTDSSSSAGATNADGRGAGFCRTSARFGDRDHESLRLTLNSDRIGVIMTSVGAPLAPGEIPVGAPDSRLRVRLVRMDGDSPAGWRFVAAGGGRIVLSSVAADRIRGSYELAFTDPETGAPSTASGAFNAPRSQNCEADR